MASKESAIKLSEGRLGFKGAKLGFSKTEGSQPSELVLHSSLRQRTLLLSVRVYHGMCLDGIEFFYEEGHSELFGTRGGKKGGSDFPLDRLKAETIIGFYVRAGQWIDALQILTSTGRRSEIYGNANGGSGLVLRRSTTLRTIQLILISHTLIPPRGYSIAGIYGSFGQWVDGFGLIITR